MPITMDKIPNDVRVPLCYFEIDNTGAVKGTPAPRWKLLIVGQKLEDAPGDALTPTLITSADQAAALWGAGSMITGMVRSIKRANTWIETWCLAVDDAEEGTPATGKIVIGGQAAAGGTINLYIAGQRVRSKVVAGEAATATLDRLGAAINAADAYVTAARGTGDDADALVLACRWAGATGNDIDLRVNYQPDEQLPQGLRLTITAMSGGAGNPDMGTVIAAFGDDWWRSLVMPYTDVANRKLLEEWLEAQWGPMIRQECQAWAAYRGALAQTAAYGNGGNSPYLSCMATGASPTPPWEWAAAYAVQASTSLAIHPARPLQTLPLVGVLAPARPDRWRKEERNILLWDGIATHRVNDDGTVAIEREVAMYQRNVWDTPDPSFLDVQTPATLAYWHYAVNARITQKYPRCCLADDGDRINPDTAEGLPVVTPRVIRAELLVLYDELVAGFIMEDMPGFKSGLKVERDANDRNRMNVLAPPDVVNQFRIFAMRTRFVL